MTHREAHFLGRLLAKQGHDYNTALKYFHRINRLETKQIEAFQDSYDVYWEEHVEVSEYQ